MHTNAVADGADVDALGSPGPGAKKFFLFVGLLTIVPAMFYPLIYELEAGLPHPPFLVITIVNVITGSFHVGTSAYFYFDREYQPLMQGDRIRFYWCLALLPFGFLALGTTASALGGPQRCSGCLPGTPLGCSTTTSDKISASSRSSTRTLVRVDCQLKSATF